MAGLLPDLPLDPRSPAINWNALSQDSLGAFISEATGEAIPATMVRGQLDKVLDHYSAQARALSQQLADGALDLDGWYAGMRGISKDAHLTALAAARGGFENLTPADYSRLGGIAAREYKYLDGFAGDLAAGNIRPGAAQARAAMYGQAGRSTYYDEEAKRAQAAGMEEEHSVLGYAEHCPECVDEASKGWVTIGTLIPIGKRLCIVNCRCHMRYRHKFGSRAQAAYIWQQAAKEGGITYNVAESYAEKHGVALSLDPVRSDLLEHAREAPGEEVITALQSYINRNADLLSDASLAKKLGLWIDDNGTMWFDIPELFPVGSDAEGIGALARGAMQVAGFDLDTFNEVASGVTEHQAEVYVKLLKNNWIGLSVAYRNRVLKKLFAKLATGWVP